LENPKGTDHAKDEGIDEKIISEWILWKLFGKMRTGFIWLRTGIRGGLL
jgi:hypothetical protein